MLRLMVFQSSAVTLPLTLSLFTYIEYKTRFSSTLNGCFQLNQVQHFNLIGIKNVTTFSQTNK